MHQFVSLSIVAIGVVVGFPLLTAMALQLMTATRSIVFIGLLPLSTAIFGVSRGGERPNLAFWIFSLIGSFLVAGFALSQSINTSLEGDVLMLGAITVCGLGYAEGARLSRSLGGWQVISWALVLALPIMAVIAFGTLPEDFDGVDLTAWVGLGYVSVFSMLVGFIFWYRGLALGGIARVGQLQLLQPFLGLFLANILLGEKIYWSMLLVSAAVAMCVAGARRYG